MSSLRRMKGGVVGRGKRKILAKKRKGAEWGLSTKRETMEKTITAKKDHLIEKGDSSH